jgi:hypothetical protein
MTPDLIRYDNKKGKERKKKSKKKRGHPRSSAVAHITPLDATTVSPWKAGLRERDRE